jgi:hypothetical protein
MSVTNNIAESVKSALNDQAIVDVHTHVYDPPLGSLLLWGIDELLTYHYLVAEVCRARPDMKYDAFWAMSKQQQADLIWDELFVKRSPISEACRGVLTVIQKLGLDCNCSNLSAIRDYFSAQTVEGYVDTVFKLANVKSVYMTNDPLDTNEAPIWKQGFERDPRFLGVLRLDTALKDWPQPVEPLKAMGYNVDSSLSESTISEVRRFLNDWITILDAKYMAISLAPDFTYPDPSSSLTTLMSKAVYPTARERGIPSAMMIGVNKAVNPALGDAGDSLGKMDIRTLERIATDFSDVKFLITLLSRENQHELAVTARKFGNILPFGCWWFLNNPSIIDEMTSERIELLGTSFIPQHSDARVLDQLIYKWTHSRKSVGKVLTRKYEDIAKTGWKVTDEAIRRDIAAMLGGGLME